MPDFSATCSRCDWSFVPTRFSTGPIVALYQHYQDVHAPREVITPIEPAPADARKRQRVECPRCGRRTLTHDRLFIYCTRADCRYEVRRPAVAS